MKTKTIILRCNFSANSDWLNASEKARCLDHREYDYFYELQEGEEIKAGDVAVVDVSGQLKLVNVKKVLTRSAKATRYCIIAFSLDRHKQILEKKQAIEDLKDQILQRAQEAKERKLLDELAQSDEGLASLLKELDELRAS